VIRDSQGRIHNITAENLGFNTNNLAKIWGLIRGVQLALDHNLTCLVIEGDSKVIIELASKILNGKNLERITPSWRLLGPLHNFQSLLKPSLTIITSHVRHVANRVADRLANAGVDLM
jgi:ribonuclease HI